MTRNLLWLHSKGRDVAPKDYYAAIPFDASSVDQDTGALDVGSDGKITVDADGGGIYLVEFGGRFARNGTGTYRQLNLAHNGDSRATSTKEGPFSDGVRVDLGWTMVTVDLAAGDVVTLDAAHDADATLRVTGRLRFTAL